MGVLIFVRYCMPEEFVEGEMSFFKVQVKKNETHILTEGEEHSLDHLHAETLFTFH